MNVIIELWPLWGYCVTGLILAAFNIRRGMKGFVHFSRGDALVSILFGLLLPPILLLVMILESDWFDKPLN